MFLFGASFLTVLFVVAQLGNGARLDSVSENLNSGPVKKHIVKGYQQPVTHPKQNEVQGDNINISIFIDKDDDDDNKVEVEHPDLEDEPSLSTDEDYSAEWLKAFNGLNTKEVKLIEENRGLFKLILDLAQSQHGVTSGRLGLWKDIIRATYIVLKNFLFNLLGNNGLFEKIVRDLYKIVLNFWTAILGQPGLLTEIIRNTRFVFYQLLTSTFGGSGLFNYAVDRFHRVKSDYTDDVYGPYNLWSLLKANQSSKGWLNEFDNVHASILPAEHSETVDLHPGDVLETVEHPSRSWLDKADNSYSNLINLEQIH